MGCHGPIPVLSTWKKPCLAASVAFPVTSRDAASARSAPPLPAPLSPPPPSSTPCSLSSAGYESRSGFVNRLPLGEEEVEEAKIHLVAESARRGRTARRSAIKNRRHSPLKDVNPHISSSPARKV